jgi:hypothetical protein
MSDEECEIVISLYTEGNVGLDGYEAEAPLRKLIGRGMVDRDEHGAARLTGDGKHVAIQLFACDVPIDGEGCA